MKVLLDIKDDKAVFLMEILQNFKFVKAKPLTPYKSDVLESVSRAVEEMNLITSGKLKARNAEEFLNEL
jgi:hypothetical protein